MLDKTFSHQCAIPELTDLAELASKAGDMARLHTLGEVQLEGEKLPLYALSMGSEAADAPAIGLFGGVHGVERIGSEVVMAYLHSLIEGLHWAPAIRQQLEHIRLVFMPVVNPGGMLRHWRANPNHVDLMRNAPLDAESKVPFLLGGQRLSRRLPWYRGQKDAPMEPEAQALCEVVKKFLLQQPFSLALDCHSGYGRKDYIWFPYAGSHKPFPHLAETLALKQLFDRTYPNHTYYEIEPQCRQYTTHGDLWDYLHMQSMQASANPFIPLTLEMGSWLWIKKNPRQLFRFPSLFNPVLPHRHQRILRRHLVLIEFLIRAVQGYKNWLPKNAERYNLNRQAMHQWYPDGYAKS